MAGDKIGLSKPQVQILAPAGSNQASILKEWAKVNTDGNEVLDIDEAAGLSFKAKQGYKLIFNQLYRGTPHVSTMNEALKPKVKLDGGVVNKAMDVNIGDKAKGWRLLHFEPAGGEELYAHLTSLPHNFVYKAVPKTGDSIWRNEAGYQVFSGKWEKLKDLREAERFKIDPYVGPKDPKRFLIVDQEGVFPRKYEFLVGDNPIFKQKTPISQPEPDGVGNYHVRLKAKDGDRFAKIDADGKKTDLGFVKAEKETQQYTDYVQIPIKDREGNVVDYETRAVEKTRTITHRVWDHEVVTGGENFFIFRGDIYTLSNGQKKLAMSAPRATVDGTQYFQDLTEGVFVDIESDTKGNLYGLTDTGQIYFKPKGSPEFVLVRTNESIWNNFWEGARNFEVDDDKNIYLNKSGALVRFKLDFTIE